MKRIYLLFLVSFFMTTLTFSQWSGNTLNGSTYRLGNVGIGVDLPENPLHIKFNSSVIRLDRPSTSTGGYIQGIQMESGTGADTWFVGRNTSGNIVFNTGNYASSTRFAILNNGKVGIGVDLPENPLHIKSNSSVIRLDRPSTSAGGYIQGIQMESGTGTDTWFVGRNTSGNIVFNTGNYASNTKLTILSSGRVGIGTSTPDYKLDVAGTIRSCEVIVDTENGCDFVFKSDYKLMSLKELEKFVKTNQHLPEIAPEKEMVENGVHMKELQMKLLQKIEEMTLYVIDLNKRVKSLEDENKELKAKLESSK